MLERRKDWNAVHQDLRKQLDAKKGAPNIAVIDETYIMDFVDRRTDFINMLDYGAGELSGQWLDWKWRQSLSIDGKYQIGLGTDIGGLVLCYRRDLLEKAGLPADRDRLTARIPTWEAFIETGRRFEAAKTGAHWVDGVNSVFLAAQSQQEIGYYDRDGTLAVAGNAGLRRAFDIGVTLAGAGLTARLASGSPEWIAALPANGFATTVCPAWALGSISGTVPDDKGKWDVAPVPSLYDGREEPASPGSREQKSEIRTIMVRTITNVENGRLAAEQAWAAALAEVNAAASDTSN